MNKARHDSLERRHSDLEKLIMEESKRPQPDENLLHELKKRKLKLKEEISAFKSDRDR
ncbi:MAG: DUF465 domain-containing protein [Parvibaculales bacterium]